MEKTYNYADIEKKWLETWQQHNGYHPSGTGEPYCIVLPPPNVTGTLHMGHGFQHTLMDALTRHARMSGYNTLWQPGTDHAGIATQMVVENELAKQNISRHDLGREKFLEKVWEWRAQSGNTITQQMQSMGNSPAWQRSHFSMDPAITKATYAAFIKLYEQGLIYRGKRLVNWDPKLHTAISDLEVVTETEQGHLWHIRYPLADGSGHLVVATTRPETLLGDSAVAVHPEDPRYQQFIGKKINLPLCNRQILIIADNAVEMEFGSGCVKITPAHDFNDYEMGKRHELPLLTIFTFDAHINENAPKAYQGLDRYDARQKIIGDLENLQLIEKIEPHQLNIPRGDRSATVIEPMLTSQWFVNMHDLAKPAMDVVDQGKLKFFPDNWRNTYQQWLDNIQDWCISRQLWWGHRIPVWYDDQGNHYVGFDEADTRQRHQLADEIVLNQDKDVLDTWFTAALWPFSSLGWPEQTPELNTFYPTSVLVTGFDIIFFWVARMVMMGLHFMQAVPFKHVYITGLIRDAKGNKMSKSKGNILDPLDLVNGISLEKLIAKRTARLMQPKMKAAIEKNTRDEFPDGINPHGTDALRFTFCALASNGRDINFDMGRLEGYRNFCNKLWNASRYVMMKTDGTALSTDPIELTLADQWIQTTLQQTIKKANDYFTQYRFDLLAATLYEFLWNQYCDWYLEFSKLENAVNPQYLLRILDNSLCLLHPLMPFITEEIWQKLNESSATTEFSSIMQQHYPQYDANQVNEEAFQQIEWIKKIIVAIRNIRGEMNISPSKKIPCLFSQGTLQQQTWIKNNAPLIHALAKIDTIDWVTDKSSLDANATAVVGDLNIHIPLAGLIDKQAEIQRLEKEISKLQKENERCQQKLNNPNYVNKAPAAVVEKERNKLLVLKNTLEKLRAQHQMIGHS